MRRDRLPGRKDRLDATPKRILLVHARDPRCGWVPVAHDAVAVEQDDAVGHVGECPRGVGALLGLLEEAGVVDGDPGASRKLERKLEVCLCVRRVRLGGDQGQRAERPAARAQGHADQRAHAELLDDLTELDVVADRLLEQRFRDLREELGLSGAEHVRHAVRVVGARRVALLKLVGPPDLLGIVVRYGEALDPAILAGHVDRAPVGEPRHGEASDACERLVVLEGRREQRARLCDEGQPLARRAFGLVQASAFECLRGLAREGDLHLAALGREDHVLPEREPENSLQTAFKRERQHRERVSVTPVGQIREEVVPLFPRRQEEGLAGADDVRHRQVVCHREASPFLHHRPLVAPLGEELDELPVVRDDPNRARSCLGGAKALREDRVKHFLRRE